MTPKQFQALLAEAGYDPGPADGLWGLNTEHAAKRWFNAGTDLLEGPSPPKPPPSAPNVPVPTLQRMSSRGIEDLIFSEGLRTHAYQDSVGVWTIGVGHAATSGRPPVPHSGMVITETEVHRILAADLSEAYEPQVRKAFGRPVPQNVYDGAVSFHFNTGSIAKASWVKKYLAGDMVGARKSFMEWKKPPEIVGRRTREAELIFEGKYAK